MIFLYNLYTFIESPYFLLAVIFISFSVKAYYFSILIPQGLRSPTIHKPWIFLLGVLAGSIVCDSAWIIKIVREIFFPYTPYTFVIFFIRLAWAFLILQYQSLGLFIESLSEKNFSLKTIHKILLFPSSLFCLYFLYMAFFDVSLMTELEREIAKDIGFSAPFEIKMMRYTVFYLLSLSLSSLFFSIKKIRTSNLPKILNKQLTIFLAYLILPYLFIEFLQGAYVSFKVFQAYFYPCVSISTLLLTYAVYYCMRKVMGLRFLNFNDHVQSKYIYNFIDDFKDALEQLSFATDMQELGHITQMFFKNAFNLSLHNVTLYIRSSNTAQGNTVPQESRQAESIVETFINTDDTSICSFMHQSKILIYDEIAFSYFYEENKASQTIVTFFNTINADIFLPIYKKQKIIAYIIIKRDARLNTFYCKMERDEMIVFATYLGNVIHLLHNRNLEALIHHEKELKAELYSKHQEINQYKESIHSFLRNTKQKEIGIICYKDRRFIYANQAAKKLVQININIQEGHPLTKKIKQIVQHVKEYKSPQLSFVKDNNNKKIVVSGVPHLEQDMVIILVYYPEISDILTKQIDLLKDPTKWDYLLYLETTQSGKLINQLIPGSGEILLNFKIELLKLALSNKALILDMADEDLMPTVEIVHHISLRETLHTIILHEPATNHDIAIKLFGINPIFGINLRPKPLLEQLDDIGTLFIKNIHFLNFETQEYLATFIKYGLYKTFKSDQKHSSNVRIICSTNQNLHMLVQEGRFSQHLLNELQKESLSMPSLVTLSEQELNDLADGFTEQAMQTQEIKNHLELTGKEKNILAYNRPVSLQEFKTRIQQLLAQKSTTNHIYDETTFGSAHTLTDPTLIEIQHIGKHALKDPVMMAMLWNKFKSQNKIATFLGVNRSSVNRRCKDYNLN